MKKTKYKYLHVTMDDSTKERLQKISDAMQVSKGSTLKEMIDLAYKQIFLDGNVKEPND